MTWLADWLNLAEWEPKWSVANQMTTVVAWLCSHQDTILKLFKSLPTANWWLCWVGSYLSAEEADGIFYSPSWQSEERVLSPKIKAVICCSLSNLLTLLRYPQVLCVWLSLTHRARVLEINLLLLDTQLGTRVTVIGTCQVYYTHLAEFEFWEAGMNRLFPHKKIRKYRWRASSNQKLGCLHFII